MLTIFGFNTIEIQCLEPTETNSAVVEFAGEVTEASLLEEIRREYADVCDLSAHPVLPPMARLIVRATEVNWQEPADCGQRTPYKTEENACRFRMQKQLEEYITKGYLRNVCLSEKVFMSPLLPIQKKDGSYRLTTDFRALNAYFAREGQEQPDVWRKLWEVEPSWRWYSKLDLKDGFFGVPVEEELQRLFAFSWRGRRYCWRRLPQGWTWSPVLFAERIAQVIAGVSGAVQFADDLLIGAETREELRLRVLAVFQRLQQFGLKVNLKKASLLTDAVTFLGVELQRGTWSLRKYLEDKVQSLGRILHWKAVERIIGVISYARKTIPDVERSLAPVRCILKYCKYKSVSDVQWLKIEYFIHALLRFLLVQQRVLALTGSNVESFHLQTDWSSGFGGFLLFFQRNGRLFMCDLGSKTMPETTSSFVGEMKALVWACKTTKALRGDVPLTIHTDNQAVAKVLNGRRLPSMDRRVSRLWGWLLANERYSVEFTPGSTNIGADLLSRPVLNQERRQSRASTEAAAVNVLTSEQEDRIQQAHSGHFGWYRTWQNLCRQPEGPWRGSKKDVRDFVSRCLPCRNFGRCVKSPPFSYWRSRFPNHTLFADFAGPWRWDEESSAITFLVLIDGFSRYCRLFICRSATATVVVRALRRWQADYGSPAFLVMDQAAAFTGSEVEQECLRQSIERVWIAPRAHWSNGVAERAIQTLLHRLQRIGRTAPWTVLLRRIEDSYNRSLHGAIGSAPVEAFLGMTTEGSELSDNAWSQILQRAEHRTEEQRQSRRQRFHRAPTAHKTLQPGDLVYYFVPQATKLSRQWEGPVRIEEAKGSNLFTLRSVQRVWGPIHAHHLKKIEP